jgi:hypothetical protein
MYKFLVLLHIRPKRVVVKMLSKIARTVGNMKSIRATRKRVSIKETNLNAVFFFHFIIDLYVDLSRFNTGIAGSNPAQGMDVCPRLSVLCCPV